MSVSFTIKNNIGIIEFNHPEAKVNLLTSEVMQKFSRLLDEIKNNPAKMEAVIITSPKRDVFIAGADIKEIEGIVDPQEGIAKSQAGQTVLDKLEDLPFPTVAVINGVALGGDANWLWPASTASPHSAKE